MKARKKFISSLLAMALVLIGFFPVQAAETAATMRLEKVEGSVAVTNASGKKATKKDGMRLFNGYSIGTQRSSYAYISLDKSKAAKLDASSNEAPVGSTVNVTQATAAKLAPGNLNVPGDNILNLNSGAMTVDPNNTMTIGGTVNVGGPNSSTDHFTPDNNGTIDVLSSKSLHINDGAELNNQGTLNVGDAGKADRLTVGENAAITATGTINIAAGSTMEYNKTDLKTSMLGGISKQGTISTSGLMVDAPYEIKTGTYSGKLTADGKAQLTISNTTIANIDVLPGATLDLNSNAVVTGNVDTSQGGTINFKGGQVMGTVTIRSENESTMGILNVTDVNTIGSLDLGGYTRSNIAANAVVNGNVKLECTESSSGRDAELSLYGTVGGNIHTIGANARILIGDDQTPGGTVNGTVRLSGGPDMQAYVSKLNRLADQGRLPRCFRGNVVL